MPKKPENLTKLIRNLRTKSYEKNVIRRDSYMLPFGKKSKKNNNGSMEDADPGRQ